MNQTASLKLKCIVLALLGTTILYQNTSYAQLKGSYTIDGSSSASSTNYKTFTSAISDMVAGTRADGGTANGKGVAGAVVFKVANGTYTEQVSISKITGASAANTIKFISASGDSSKVVLTSASSTSASTNYTLELNAARYITIQQITISRTGTNAYGIVVALTGSTAFNQFIGNRMMGIVDPSTSALGIIAGNAVLNATGADSNCTFSGNRFKNGYNSMAFTTTSYGYNNSISNNIFDTAGMAGVYATNNQTNMVISGNTFNMGPFTGFSGHFVSYGVRLENAVNYKVIKNSFYATSGASISRCIVLFFGTTSTGKRNLIANNFAWVSAGSTSSTGITLGGNANLDVFYNNVLMTSVALGSAALYVYPQYTGSSNIFLNNNLINKGSGTAIDNSNDPSSSGYTTGVARSNYNNLYTKGTYIGNYQGTLYKTLSDWQSGTSFDSNSVNVDPGYASNTDLHVSSSGINNKGIPVSAVTDDIDGDKRNATTPDIGADEFTPAALDAGITSLDSPAVFCAPKTSNVVVKFTNFGTSTLTTLKINWSVNGSLQSPYSWSGSVTTGNISPGITIGKFAFSAKTPYIVKVWTTGPNGGTDQKNTNDTLVKSIASGMSGTYTIGGTSPDFKTFNEALDAVTLRGLCGATIFNVRNGTYVEQISVPNYTTLSASSTLTFQSEKGDSSKVILTLPSVSANGVNNVVLQLNGCRYVTFKQITILRTGPGAFQGVIEIKGKACNNSFINNAITGVKLTVANITGDVVSSAADKDTANIFRNNLIRYGNMAFNMSGDAANHETGNIIDGNQVDSCFNTAINVVFNDGISIKNNSLTNACYGNGAYMGVLLSNCNNAIKVTANKIMMPNGGNVGIYLFNSTGKSGAEGLVANNFISIGKGSVAPLGIVDSVSPYQNIYYNSVDIYNISTGVCFYANAGGNINLLNNIFYNNGGGYAIVIPNNTTIASSDYNDLYSSSAYLGFWNGSVAYDLPSWQSASSLDSNSISVNPRFLSNTDYHTKNPYLHGKGKAVSNVVTDIEGKTRGSKPSIGALEFRTAANDAAIPGLSSPYTVCEGTSSVIVLLKNTGSTDLTSATINWSVGGTLQTAYSFSGKINPDSTRAIKIGSYKFAVGTPVVKIWSSAPNGKADSFPYNDTLFTTITVNAIPAAKAGTAATICSKRSISIGAAAVGTNKYSWISRPAGFVSTSANPTVSPIITTTYILTETSAAGCSKTDSVTITVLPSPVAAVGLPRTLCEGDTINLGDKAITGNTYSWKSNPAGFTSSISNPVLVAGTTAYYVLTVTNTNSCVSKDSVKITVNPRPAAIVAKSFTVCNGNTVKIGGNAVSGNTYSWTSNPSGFTSAIANPSVSPANTTKYTLVEKTTATGCFNANSTTITVVNQPTAGAINGPQTVCAGASAIYTPATFTNGFDYIYKPALTTGSTYGQSGDSLTIHFGTAGTATLWMIAKVSSGTCKDSTKISINVNPSPKAKFTASEICFGGTTSFTNASSNAIKSTWNFGDGDTLTADNPTHKYKKQGVYKLKLLILNSSGCYDSTFVNVTVDSLPKPAFKTAAAKCIGAPISFTNTTAGAIKSHSWDFGDGGSDATASPSHTYAKTGPFKVTLTETNNAGCTDTVSHIVVVSPLPSAHYTVKHGHGYIYNFLANDTTQTKYIWDFGDTTTGVTGAHPSHTFSGDNTYHVKLSVVNVAGCTSTNDSMIKTTNNTGINQEVEGGFNFDIYPNPFNDKTVLAYTLHQDMKVKIMLTDITGKQIAELTNAVQPAGNYSYTLDAHAYHLQPGIYFINMTAAGMVVTRRIVKLE
jgi:PKD repeat protein